MTPETICWVDAGMGVAGDMLLGALLDAGADIEAVRRAVNAVIPGEVRITTRQVQRCGMRALQADVVTTVEDHPHRTWATIRGLIERAAPVDVPEAVRRDALAVFARLAEAEGAVHGVPADEATFHEVGSWDSIADIVGVCAAMHALGVQSLTYSPIRLGDGQVRAAHGEMAVPVPAVLELMRAGAARPGAPTTGAGELATPTGVALLTTLGACAPTLPSGVPTGIGVGAGTKDPAERPNVVRVVLIAPDLEPTAGGGGGADDGLLVDHLVQLDTNVDDLDPRVWPSVLSALLEAGALDAWLTPIVMKKGRPAHTLSALVAPDARDVVVEQILRQTSTLGIRETTVRRVSLQRSWQPVELEEGPVRIKLGHRRGVVLTATPEYEEVAALAQVAGRPVGDLLREAQAAAERAGLTPGAALGAAQG